MPPPPARAANQAGELQLVPAAVRMYAQGLRLIHSARDSGGYNDQVRTTLALPRGKKYLSSVATRALAVARVRVGVLHPGVWQPFPSRRGCPCFC